MRFKRFLSCLFPWLLALSLAAAQDKPADKFESQWKSSACPRSR